MSTLLSQKPIRRLVHTGGLGGFRKKSQQLHGLRGICTSPMCDQGAASIQEMDSVYQNLDASLQPQFQSAHDTLMSTFQQNYSWYSSYIPFNSQCCAIQSIGQQADALTQQMQQAAGQVPLTPGPGTQGAPGSLSSILFPAAIVVLGVVWLSGRR